MSDELFQAVLAGDVVHVTALLNDGADVNATRRDCWLTVLQLATRVASDLGREHVPLSLGRRRTSAHPEVVWTWTPLLLAAARWDWEIALLLLRRGADAGVADEQGHTPLLFAARRGQPLVVRALLEGGADPNRAGPEGRTPLLAAASRGQWELLLDPLDFVASFQAERADSDEMEAVPAGAYLDILAALLAAGADPNLAGASGVTPLIRVSFQGWTDAARLLLDHGAVLEAQAELVGTAMMAALPLHVGTARLLIERGADVNAAVPPTGTPLTCAIGAAWPAMRPGRRRRKPDPERPREPLTTDRLLAGLGASAAEGAPNERTEYLHAVRLVLDHGADVNQADAEGESALFTAVRLDAVETICLLVERGADLDARDARGRTPLMLAAFIGRPRSARALLDAGADPNARGPSGETALSAAAAPGIPERMLRKMETMPVSPPDPEIEASLQRLREVREKLGERATEVPDPDDLAQLPARFRESMRGHLEESIARQHSEREEVIRILKEAGAAE